MCKLKVKRGDPSKVNARMAELALERAGGDRSKAYSECIRLMFQATGKFGPGFDNEDLQAWYNQYGKGNKGGDA